MADPAAQARVRAAEQEVSEGAVLDEGAVRDLLRRDADETA